MNLPPSRLCRARLGAAAFIAWASAAASFAQTAAAPSPTAKKPEDESSAVIMSPFEVIMTQDKGYQTGNSANALKTDEKIMEIPQSITVLTRSMIEDLGSGNLSDVLNYAGVGNVFQGDTAVVRGQRVNMLTDGSGDGQQQGPTFDSSMIDSITIVRGPAAVLYGLQSSLGGMIQKNTRIPLPKRGGTIIFQADEFGLMRGEVDFSTPLGQVGQSKFSMRTDLSYQDGKSFFKNSDNDRSVGYLALQMQRPETTIRVNGSYQTTKMIPHRNIFLSPDGTPYAGAGREQDYQPPGMKVERVDHNVRGQVLQRLFPGWDLQARGTFNRNSYSQGVMLGNLADFQNREARFTARWNRLAQKIYVGDLAVLGKYTLLGRKAESFLGGSMNDTTNKPSYFPGDPTFGIDNASRGVGRAQANNILAVSMDAPPIESIRIRQENAYYPILPTTAGNRGVRQSFVQHNLFYQQKIELVPNRLTLTASLSKFRQENTTENLTEPAPPTLTATAVQRQNRLLHRVGLVYNLTNSIVLYAIESTTINVQTSRLIDGGITPPQDGKQREVGIKTDFANGKLSLTASLYDIRLTNVGVNPGGVSPITGASYVVLIGKTKNQGGDIVLSARPLPNWYLTLNYDQHFVHDQNDNGRLPNTNTGSAGMFTRWDFKQESLKKWAIGGGANRFFNRFTGGSTIRFADGSAPAGNGTAGSVAAIRLKDGTGATLFIDYKATKKLTLKLTVNNLFDEFYAVGAQHAFSIDPSLPRNLMFSAYYRF